MQYFGHDTDCLTDPNLKKVRAKYKSSGLGIYWHCNEAIALHLDPPNGIECVLNEDIPSIAHELYESVDLVAEVLEYFVEIGLFTKTTDNKYQNLKLLKRLDRYSRLKLAKQAKKLDVKIDMDTMSTDEVLSMLTVGAKTVSPLNLTKPNLTKLKKPLTAGAVNFDNLTSKEFAVKDLFEKTYKEIVGHDIDYDNVTDINREIEAIKGFVDYSPELLHKMIIKGLSNKLEKIKHSCTTLSGVWLNRNYLKMNDETSAFKGSEKDLSIKKQGPERDGKKIIHKIQMA